MFIKENLNPLNKNVQDCVIRSMAKVLNQPWRRTYIELAVYGYAIADLPSADAVWNVYLLDKGLKKYVLPSDCPNCMTVREFSERYKEGEIMAYNSYYNPYQVYNPYQQYQPSFQQPMQNNIQPSFQQSQQQIQNGS